MDKENILKYLNKNIIENSEILKNFLFNNKDLYSRKNEVGHLTASAFILSKDLKNVLLIHHAKYNIWLSPGGHVDLNENTLEAMIRETKEETGLTNLDLLYNEILDIDIHRIPYSEKKKEEEHWHFDIRYALVAPKKFSINLNLEECKGYQWVSLESLKSSEDISLKRQALKVDEIIKNIENKKTSRFKI